MIISAEQRTLLTKYIEKPSDDIDLVLLELDNKITEIGFDIDYELNNIGIELQRLYDELYNQN